MPPARTRKTKRAARGEGRKPPPPGPPALDLRRLELLLEATGGNARLLHLLRVRRCQTIERYVVETGKQDHFSTGLVDSDGVSLFLSEQGKKYVDLEAASMMSKIDRALHGPTDTGEKAIELMLLLRKCAREYKVSLTDAIRLEDAGYCKRGNRDATVVWLTPSGFNVIGEKHQGWISIVTRRTR